MIHVGDCLEVLRTMTDASVDAIVTDPPYGIGFMGKAWDGADIEARLASRRAAASADPTAAPNGAHRSAAAAAGSYDLSPVAMRAFQEFSAEWAREVFRVMKPGAHLVAFASPRTFHRLVCGVEEAGFEIRDTLMWVFGSGFPKSKNLAGAWQGWGTALKPAWEPIVLARKPLSEANVAANVARWRTGALNIDGCRIGTGGEEMRAGAGGIPCRHDERTARTRAGEDSADRRYADRGSTNFAAAPGPRGGDPAGRWPANLIHDGSPEVVERFPQDAGAASPVSTRGADKFRNSYGAFAGEVEQGAFHGDSGSAARFFYCAKASRADRNEGCEHMDERPLLWSSGEANPGSFQSEGTKKAAQNYHPTVKPTELMRYLCRLVTPAGGLILDPFAGSGSTGKAAAMEGFRFVGIELDPAYAAIAEARIRAAQPGLSFGDVA